MKVKIVFDDIKDKELIELVSFSTPFFIEYINANFNKKEAFKIKSEFGARKNPFVVVYDDEDNFISCFWSEDQNACQSFVNLYKNDCKN